MSSDRWSAEEVRKRDENRIAKEKAEEEREEREERTKLDAAAAAAVAALLGLEPSAMLNGDAGQYTCGGPQRRHELADWMGQSEEAAAEAAGREGAAVHTGTRVLTADGKRGIVALVHAEQAPQNQLSIGDDRAQPWGGGNYGQITAWNSEFHERLEAEIRVKGHNCPLPLLFDSMLEHRAEKNTNFTIPTKDKWHDIQCQVVEGKGGKLISKWGLVIRPRGGQAEAAALGSEASLSGCKPAKAKVVTSPALSAAHPLGAVLTAAPTSLVDSKGRRYVHQGEVFGVLMAALLEANSMKGLKEKVDQEYCNITNVVVDDFLRALDVCYYLAGVSAPAGSMRFASLCPPPCHRAYLQSKNLQKVLRSLSDVELTETAAERFKDLLARIKDFLARKEAPATLVLSGETVPVQSSDTIEKVKREIQGRPPPTSAGMSTVSLGSPAHLHSRPLPPGLALSASAQQADAPQCSLARRWLADQDFTRALASWKEMHPSEQRASLLASLERARPAQEASRALSGMMREPEGRAEALAVEDPARAEAKSTRPMSLNDYYCDHEAAWSDALKFFFAAMLEHRAEEYENFNVPKKEKWDRIVKQCEQVLQGLPGRKRRKLEKGDEGPFNTAEEQRRAEQETDRMIQRWNLRVEAEQIPGTAAPKFVLISIDGRSKPGGRGMFGMYGAGGGANAAPKAAAAPAAGAAAKTVGESSPQWQEIHDETYNAPYWWNVHTGATTWEKPAALCRRRRYVHQGEVFEVLMGFLREQPTQENEPLRLQHAGASLKDIQRKVETIYCNITDEVIKDLFRALDLCYYLFDIPRPAGSITFDSHPDLKPVKKLDFLRAYLEQPFRSKLIELNHPSLKALLKHGAAVRKKGVEEEEEEGRRRAAVATPGMQQGVATRPVCEPRELTCITKLPQAVRAAYMPRAGFDSEPGAEKRRLHHVVSLFLGSALRLGGRWAKFQKLALAKLEMLEERMAKLEKQGGHRLVGGNAAVQGAAPRGQVQVKREGCSWTGSNAASTAFSSDTCSSELSSLAAKPVRPRRPPPPPRPTEQYTQPMQMAAPMFYYAHPPAGSMPVGMGGPQQMHMVAPPPGVGHMVAPPPGVGSRGMPAYHHQYVPLMPGPSRDGLARCEQSKDCAGWPMAPPPGTVGQSSRPC